MFRYVRIAQAIMTAGAKLSNRSDLTVQERADVLVDALEAISKQTPTSFDDHAAAIAAALAAHVGDFWAAWEAERPNEVATILSSMVQAVAQVTPSSGDDYVAEVLENPAAQMAVAWALERFFQRDGDKSMAKAAELLEAA